MDAAACVMPMSNILRRLETILHNVLVILGLVISHCTACSEHSHGVNLSCVLAIMSFRPKTMRL